MAGGKAGCFDLGLCATVYIRSGRAGGCLCVRTCSVADLLHGHVGSCLLLEAAALRQNVLFFGNPARKYASRPQLRQRRGASVKAHDSFLACCIRYQMEHVESCWRVACAEVRLLGRASSNRVEHDSRSWAARCSLDTQEDRFVHLQIWTLQPLAMLFRILLVATIVSVHAPSKYLRVRQLKGARGSRPSTR